MKKCLGDQIADGTSESFRRIARTIISTMLRMFSQSLSVGFASVGGRRHMAGQHFRSFDPTLSGAREREREMIMVGDSITPEKIDAEIRDAQSVIRWLEREIKLSMVMARKMSKAGRRKEAKRFYNQAKQQRNEARNWKARLLNLLEMRELMRR